MPVTTAATTVDPFHAALAASGADGLFQNLPVQWWDRAASLWRPSVIYSVSSSPSSTRPRLIILVPAYDLRSWRAVRFVHRRVRLEDLELMKCPHHAVTRFAIRTFRLTVIMRTLLLRLDEMTAQQQASVRVLVLHTINAYARAYWAWREEFCAGMLEHAVHSVYWKGCDGDPLGVDTCSAQHLTQPRYEPGLQPVAHFTASYITMKLGESKRALRVSGWDEPSIARHPIVMTLQAMLTMDAATYL